MIVGREMYNLKNVLNAYEEHIRHEDFVPNVKENIKFQESKEKTGKMAMQVIAIGVGQFTEDQKKTLIDFINHHFERIPKDPVVALGRVILVVQRLNRLPDDVSVVIQSFREITALNFLTEKEKKKVASYAANEILQAKMSTNCAELFRLTKIITFGWNELEDRQQDLVKKLDDLRDNIEKAQKFPELGVPFFHRSSTQEFCDLALILSNDYMENFIPKEIKTHLAYHGETLKFGLREIIKQTCNFNISLQEFTLDYEEAMLKKNQFLIIKHLSTPFNESGNEYFPMRLAWRDAFGSKRSSRFTCIKNAKGEICLSDTPRSKQIETFQSLDHFIKSRCDGLAMCVAPSHETVVKLLSKNYTPISENAPKRKKLN